MARKSPKRSHGFVGRIYKVISDEMGFIRPNAVRRMDGGNPGLDIDDDLFVHLNAFRLMESRGFETPERLEEGMVIAFVIGPSQKQNGRVTAEYCSIFADNVPEE